jgi:uncharacterized membrane protein
MMRRHKRFLAAFVAGLFAAVLAHLAGFERGVQALAAVDVFYVVYLGLMLPLAKQSPADLRKRAATEDEGAWLIVLLASLVVAIGLMAVLSMLTRGTVASMPEPALALASVPLGWAMVHTMMSFHYAHIFYGRGPGKKDHGGFIFPGGADPCMLDFLYLGFGIGMTAQVADVAVTQSSVRRGVLLHCVASFFLNTVILALAVNTAVGMSG